MYLHEFLGMALYFSVFLYEGGSSNEFSVSKRKTYRIFTNMTIKLSQVRNTAVVMVFQMRPFFFLDFGQNSCKYLKNIIWKDIRSFMLFECIFKSTELRKIHRRMIKTEL